MSADNRFRDMIAASGPQGFDTLVDVGLYDPTDGWYTTGGRAGRRDGHFITSPEVGPIFGRIVARWLDDHWTAAGQPDRFVVAEVGAGRGRLARSVVAARPRCLPALRYLMVEQSARQRTEHAEVIAAADGTVRSCEQLPEPDERDGDINVVLANELLDNLPFRVVRQDRQRVAGAGWAEVKVDVDPQGDFVETLAPLQLTRAELELLNQASGAVNPSQDPRIVIEVPLAAPARDWVLAMSQRADHVLVFDYGEPTAVLAGRPDRGWLRTYRHNGRGGSPLEHLGTQDITIDVPLDQLPPPRRATRQAAWLERHGLATELQAADQVLKANPGTANLAAIRARSAAIEAAALTDRSGLGNFVVAEW